MSLSQALSTSVAGLRATQVGLSLVASNIANAQTPGYVRKTLVQETSSASDSGSSVRIAAINREIDTYVQRQLRVETSGGAYASLRSDFYQRLQQLYGSPGSDSALETVFNKFTSAVQELAASPEAPAARSTALSSAQVLAQHLNGMTTDIQSLRSDAENGLSDAVARANDALQKIATLNSQLTNSNEASAAVASWEDQRDMYVDQLSELMDVRVVVGDHKEYNVFTSSGVQLVGTQAAKLAFNSQGTVTPATQWSPDPSQSNLGTLRLVSATGSSIDLIANKSIRSGKIAAYIEMRDQVLVEAQDQLDAVAAAMSQALSDDTTAAGAVNVGAQSGFDVDLSGLLPGNTINLDVMDYQSNRKRHLTIVRVDDPGALPLKNTATTDPNDEVIGVDFSHGLASVVSQLNTKLNGKVVFSNPAGNTLRVLDDGLPNLSDVTAASVTRTVNGLSTGSLSLPFFVDATSPFSGALSKTGPQSLGFAGRIAVNSALIGDPSKLVLYGPGSAAGDPARPDFIYQRIANTSIAFSPRAGFGTAASPFVGTLPTMLRQVLSQQGDAASSAQSLSEGQDVVVNNLKQRVADQSNVNVDQEMANLMTLQTAYGANARVMSAIKDMLQYLMNM